MTTQNISVLNKTVWNYDQGQGYATLFLSVLTLGAGQKYCKRFFISKGHYSKKFYLEKLLFRRSFCPEGLLFRIQNNDFEIKIFGIMTIYRNKNLSEYDPSEYRTVPTVIYSIVL